MSLYVISNAKKLPLVKQPEGLRIERSTDLSLLSTMGTTTIEDVVNRLANNHVAYVAYLGTEPAAFGWMARGEARIGELNHRFILPERNRYLWNFRTLEAFRGLKIYPDLLQFIIKDEAKDADNFWIIHAPENNASLNGILKAGFEFLGKLYSGLSGQATIEFNTRVKAYKGLLSQMNITLSEEVAASCWNCSSPYLKKRKPACCCATSDTECIGNNFLAMAS